MFSECKRWHFSSHRRAISERGGDTFEPTIICFWQLPTWESEKGDHPKCFVLESYLKFQTYFFLTVFQFWMKCESCILSFILIPEHCRFCMEFRWPFARWPGGLVWNLGGLYSQHFAKSNSLVPWMPSCRCRYISFTRFTWRLFPTGSRSPLVWVFSY